jgi:hypothetical protein
MSRSTPVQLLPNGKHIYQDPGGTFSHQHPTEGWWCERHTSIEDAMTCYKLAQQKVLQPPPQG